MNIGQGDLCLLLQVIWESTLPDIYFKFNVAILQV